MQFFFVIYSVVLYSIKTFIHSTYLNTNQYQNNRHRIIKIVLMGCTCKLTENPLENVSQWVLNFHNLFLTTILNPFHNIHIFMLLPLYLFTTN